MDVNHQLTTTRTIGQGVGFERTARITGYLSSVPRFCNAKQAELKDRVLHVGKPATCIGYKSTGIREVQTC